MSLSLYSLHFLEVTVLVHTVRVGPRTSEDFLLSCVRQIRLVALVFWLPLLLDRHPNSTTCCYCWSATDPPDASCPTARIEPETTD